MIYIFLAASLLFSIVGIQAQKKAPVKALTQPLTLQAEQQKVALRSQAVKKKPRAPKQLVMLDGVELVDLSERHHG